jgi:hypothetical protein
MHHAVDTGVMSSVAPEARKAGQHAQERARRMNLQSLLCIAILLAWIPLSALTWGFASPRFLVAELLGCVGLALVNRRDRAIERWQKGADGEKLVGGVLDSLYEQDWRVLHDISFGAGNIDHAPVQRAGTQISPDEVALDALQASSEHRPGVRRNQGTRREPQADPSARHLPLPGARY